MTEQSRRHELTRRLRATVAQRYSPEHTRAATLLERMTVERLGWEQLVRLNRYLELLGRLTTAVWIGFIASVVLGYDWKDAVHDAVNGGRPVRGAAALALILPTLAFVAARSMIGFARWRLQRELWRRDVRRLTTGG